MAISVLEVHDRRGRTWKQRQPVQTSGRRAAIATLLLGGGRASATGAMLWRDVDLANGRFEVGRDKTGAGMREVDMLPLLGEILTDVAHANRRVEEHGLQPLPLGITPHKRRHTFASRSQVWPGNGQHAPNPPPRADSRRGS